MPSASIVSLRKVLAWPAEGASGGNLDRVRHTKPTQQGYGSRDCSRRPTETRAIGQVWRRRQSCCPRTRRNRHLNGQNPVSWGIADGAAFKLRRRNSKGSSPEIARGDVRSSRSDRRRSPPAGPDTAIRCIGHRVSKHTRDAGFDVGNPIDAGDAADDC